MCAGVLSPLNWNIPRPLLKTILHSGFVWCFLLIKLREASPTGHSKGDAVPFPACPPFRHRHHAATCSVHSSLTPSSPHCWQGPPPPRQLPPGRPVFQRPPLTPVPNYAGVQSPGLTGQRAHCHLVTCPPLPGLPPGSCTDWVPDPEPAS